MGFETQTFELSSLALYYLSYPGSIDGTGPNFFLENNAIKCVVVCDTVFN